MKQSTALNILKTGQNVFLTGQAGAGKTYVLNQYVDYLRVRGIGVATTASTGIASTHMNGMTIHAWSGMGIKDSFDADDYKRLKSRKVVVERLMNTKVLIIDEISMLHAKQVDLLDEILRKIRNSDDAFGGMQVVFSGDFFQLPPVGTKDESKERFAFMSKAWVTANFQICYLSEQYRQHTDQDNNFGISLNEILNQIRQQQITQTAINALRSTINNDLSQSRIRLYTHNASVDKINEEQLNALSTPVHVYTCTTFGDNSLVESLKKNVRTSDELTLKKGAKVMFIKNNPMLDVYNGSMGEVIDFVMPSGVIGQQIQQYPLIRLNNGREVVALPEEWSIDDAHGETLASYTQVPLCLAWAITIHKSQGMTLDSAEIDLSNTFETGQGYVALSRLRSLDGLKLLGMNLNSLNLDEWVFRINDRLLQLSAEHEQKFSELDEDIVKKLHLAFVEVCDGISDPKLIAKYENALNQKRLAKQTKQAQKQEDSTQSSPPSHTLQVSDDLFRQGLSVEAVASQREFAIATIINHLDKLVKLHGDEPYIHLKPADDVLSDITTAYNTLKAQGVFDEKLTLRPIVEHLDNKYTYNQIRLTLCFIDTDKADT